MKLKDAVFTVFDFETTGLYPYTGDRICEVGAVKFGPGIRRKKFQSLVNPCRKISNGAFLVNGISDEMVKSAPTAGEILPEFMKFIGGSVLVAYNAGFDLGFLEAALGEKARELDALYIVDALALARQLFPGSRRYSLGAVSEHLGIEVKGEHRAMADAMMTMEVFKKELSLLKKKGVKDISEIAYERKARPDHAVRVRDYRTDMIEKAIRDEKKLNIIYRSVWTSAVTSRTITPKALREGYDKSYVVAYCHTMNAERNFRMDGIVEIKDA